VSSPATLVLNAVQTTSFDFRTVEGISRDMGLAQAEVTTILSTLRDEVRVSHATDNSGGLLYTRRDHRVSIHEMLCAPQQSMALHATGSLYERAVVSRQLPSEPGPPWVPESPTSSSPPKPKES
jgi:hypothetical protein